MMGSDDILAMLMDSLIDDPTTRLQMKTSLAKGSNLFFVDADTGHGRLCLFQRRNPPPYPNLTQASDGLHIFFEVPKGELWLCSAEDLEVPPLEDAEILNDPE